MQSFPMIIYGTAWKEDQTETLVDTAIQHGFRAIDTACQRKHYFEEGVGKALVNAFQKGLKRSDVFLQTKFTHIDGQDHRLPYDPNVVVSTQVEQSFQTSLRHLHVDTIDSYILHGPSQSVGLSDQDWGVWQAMETLYDSGKIKHLGISNVDLDQLISITEHSRIPPTFVQNRCFAHTGWDQSIREYCVEKKMVYQGFSLLTANPFVLTYLTDIAQKIGKTPAQIVFRFAQHVGILPLTGTTDSTHMKDDLLLDFELNDRVIHHLETGFLQSTMT